MLIMDEVLPGLSIIQSQAYHGLLIQRHSRLMHLNLGDFYSEVPLSLLPDVFYQSLDDLLGNEESSKIKIVEASAFDSRLIRLKGNSERLSFEEHMSALENELGYIVKDENGVRLYSPLCHVSKDRLPISGVSSMNEYYTSIGLMIAPKILSDKKSGTLTIKAKQFEETFNNMVEEGVKNVMNTLKNER